MQQNCNYLINEIFWRDGTVLEKGLLVMFVGMSVVFSFLALMVCTMNISAVISKKLSKYFPEEPDDKGSSAGESSNQEIAVAIAAIQSHSK